jgi:hypothetical protein
MSFFSLFGKPHPDRNAQFEFISKKAKDFIDAGEPVRANASELLNR